MECDRIFVYGTLRNAVRPDVHARYLGTKARYLGTGDTAGDLWRVTWYPAMTFGGGRVKGEVYQIGDPRVWSELDEYEACDLERPETSEYTRKVVNVRLDDAREISAWCYFYLGKTGGLVRIASGDFAGSDTNERDDGRE